MMGESSWPKGGGATKRMQDKPPQTLVEFYKQGETLSIVDQHQAARQMEGRTRTWS